MQVQEVQGNQDRTAEGGSRQREHHGEARDEQPTVAGQHVPRRKSGKATPQGHAVAVTTQEAPDGSREDDKKAGSLTRSCVPRQDVKRQSTSVDARCT